MLDAGILLPGDVPIDLEYKGFPVIKANGVDVHMIGDFRGLNTVLQKLLWHTERHIPTDTKLFSATSRFYQVKVDKQASKLLTIVANMLFVHEKNLKLK